MAITIVKGLTSTSIADAAARAAGTAGRVIDAEGLKADVLSYADALSIRRYTEVCRKLSAGTAVSFAFDGDSFFYGMSPTATIAAINGRAELRAATPLPETFGQAVGRMSASAITIYNHGIPGDRADEWPAQWGASAVADVTFLDYSTNEAIDGTGVTVDAYITAMRYIIESRRAAGSLVVLVAPPWLNADTDRPSARYRSVLRQLASAYGLLLFDAEKARTRRWSIGHNSDIHLLAREYADIAFSLAAYFSPKADSIPVVAPGSLISILHRPGMGVGGVNNTYSTSGGGSGTRAREQVFLNVGSSFAAVTIPVMVASPCRLVVENQTVSAFFRVRADGYGTPVALNGDGAAAADIWAHEPRYDHFSCGSTGAGARVDEPQVGMELDAGPRLITLESSASSAANLYVSGLRFESIDPPREWAKSLKMSATPWTILHETALEPGTSSFGCILICSGWGIYPNPDATVVLIDKLTGNTGWSLSLLTTRQLRLIVGNGSALSTYDSPRPCRLNMQGPHAFGFSFIRSGRIFFYEDGATLGSLDFTGFGAGNVTNSDDLVVAPSAAGVFVGGLFLSRSDTIDSGTHVQVLRSGPAAALGALYIPNAAGQVISSTVASGSAVSLTTATTANVTSLALTAGDWDVTGVVNFVLTGTTATDFQLGSHTTSATIGGENSFIEKPFSFTGLSSTYADMIPTMRYNVSSATTVYLVARSVFTVGTVTAYGTIVARRRAEG